jgi:hypothetical protein
MGSRNKTFRMSVVVGKCYTRRMNEGHFLCYSNPVEKSYNVQLQSVRELERLLVSESGKSVTIHLISVHIFTFGGVELNRHRMPRGSAVGEMRTCECTAEVKQKFENLSLQSRFN